MEKQEHWTAHVRYILAKYEGEIDPDNPDPSRLVEVVEGEGNLLLNEGIGTMWDLIIGVGGVTPYNNANSYIGVGDSTTAAAPTQTGLLGTNKFYKGMDAGYPSRSGNTVTWRATFGTAEANFAWNEWTIANGNSDAAMNMNRKVESLGTKPSTQSWQFTVQVTLS